MVCFKKWKVYLWGNRGCWVLKCRLIRMKLPTPSLILLSLSHFLHLPTAASVCWLFLWMGGSHPPPPTPPTPTPSSDGPWWGLQQLLQWPPWRILSKKIFFNFKKRSWHTQTIVCLKVNGLVTVYLLSYVQMNLLYSYFFCTLYRISVQVLDLGCMISLTSFPYYCHILWY